MMALIWKDFRLNRLLLTHAFLMMAGPLLIGIVYNLFFVDVSEISPWTPKFWRWVGSCGMGLSLLTFAMLGSSAIATERVDRSAEFLAYLPVSRRQILLSKTIVALVPAIAIWVVYLITMFVLPSLCAKSPDEARLLLSSDSFEFLRFAAPTSVLFLGAGWFWSSVMRSHALAMGFCIGVFAGLGCLLCGIEYAFGLHEFVMVWFLRLSYILGALGFAAGWIYYLYRIEP